MVFIGGPRQVGKTTLAKGVLANVGGQYLNWDAPDDKRQILKGEFKKDDRLLIFDEIHKYARWRGLLKGIYDKYAPETRILVTGSARLDYFRKGGDSLVGRYHYFRLHPFSVGELGLKTKKDLASLIRFGGFPEPFLRQSDAHYRRWANERITRVTTEDLRDLESVKDISLVELLAEMLPSRVGSLLSIQSLQEDLNVSPNTVLRWIEILETLYVCYRIAPFGTERAKAVKKAQKLYLWDWAQVADEGSRFENLVASHLLKFCHYRQDSEGYKMELRFYRDADRREVDFIVVQDKRPIFAVECKTGERQLSRSLDYVQTRFRIPRVFQVHLGERDFGNDTKGGRVLPFTTFSEVLQIP
jgi:predicted AAA+ superfamily ATPase